MYRSPRRACSLSEKALKQPHSGDLSCYFCMGLMGVSASSLHIESTDSMILGSFDVYNKLELLVSMDIGTFTFTT